MKKLLLLIVVAYLGACVPLFAADTPDVETLIKDLRSVKADQRARAAEALGQLGPYAAPAVKALVASLADKSAEVQYEALIALEHIGPAARAAVPDLVALLKSPQSRLYTGAIDALGSIGRDSQEAVPLLLTLLKGDDEHVATSAGRALSRILPPDSDELKQAVPVLVKSLKAKSQHVRDEAVVALGSCGSVAVPALIELVKGHAANPEPAWEAAGALGFMGPAAQPAAGSLTEALSSRHEKVVIYAAGALGAIGPEAKGAVAALRKLLASPNPSIRVHVANALGNLGPAAESAVGDLTKALKDPNEDMRREAASALGNIGPSAKAAVPALVAALNDENGSVTLHAAEALGRIGPDVVPALLPALKDPRLQHLAVMILGSLGPAAKPAAGALASTLAGYDKELTDDERDFCREIVLTLAHIGPDAREAAAPTLLKILANEKLELRAGAGWALAKMGDKRAAPLLKKALEKDDSSRLHVVAPMALMLLEPTNDEYAKLAIPRLIEALDNKFHLIRREAAATLALLGPKAAPAVEKLATMLADPDPAIRSDALSALASIGPASAPALPQVLPQLSAPEIPVRCAASYAVGKIGSAAKGAVPLLERNLQERDDVLQIASAWALVHVDSRREGLADECLGPLIRLLKHPDPRARNEAVAALALMGRAARPAVPALEAIARDPDETVRKSVTEALKQIAK
ncbi:MAG: HEAT repeat domain-containing protein [Deltaproteobacteria bacterium]